MKNFNRMPGPGDPETWGPYCGHPLDPRAPLDLDEEGHEDEPDYEPDDEYYQEPEHYLW